MKLTNLGQNAFLHFIPYGGLLEVTPSSRKKQIILIKHYYIASVINCMTFI